jgi:hypothetical protein
MPVLIKNAINPTEVNYFKGLIGDLKLSTVNIEILDIKQNTPDSLLREAK